MPFNMGLAEILVLLVVSVILFGGRLPEVARTVGRTIASFKRGMGAELGRLDLDLRETDDPPYRPARRSEPARRPPDDPPDENCESGWPEEDPEAAAEEPRGDAAAEDGPRRDETSGPPAS